MDWLGIKFKIWLIDFWCWFQANICSFGLLFFQLFYYEITQLFVSLFNLIIQNHHMEIAFGFAWKWSKIKLQSANVSLEFIQVESNQCSGLPYSISRCAVSKRFFKLSGVSVLRSIKRRFSSSIDGGITNTNTGFKSDARTCLTPSHSISRTHTLPTSWTFRTARLLHWLRKWWSNQLINYKKKCKILAKIPVPCSVQISTEFGWFQKFTTFNGCFHLFTFNKMIMDTILFTRTWFSCCMWNTSNQFNKKLYFVQFFICDK